MKNVKRSSTTDATWHHIITDEGGAIVAVFGDAEEDMAAAISHKIARDCGYSYRRQLVFGRRPSVGQLVKALDTHYYEEN